MRYIYSPFEKLNGQKSIWIIGPFG